jgi:hypothetical protein
MEPPDLWEELAVAHYAHNRAMCREQEVVKAHSRLWRFRVSVRVLRLYGGRVEKRGGRHRVHAKAKDIERRKVDSETERRFAFVVRYGLRIKATRLPVASVRDERLQEPA